MEEQPIDTPTQLLKRLSEPFHEFDVQWRISRAGKTKDGAVWARCIPYFDPRMAMDRLDQVVGPENWQDSYRKEATANICRLSIRLNGEWISKEDAAENTDIEAIKGGISGAFKRAVVKFGIGRYMYNLEETSARIVDRDFPEAIYASSEKTGTYYWLPPRLPGWALPGQSGYPPAPTHYKLSKEQESIRERHDSKPISPTNEAPSSAPSSSKASALVGDSKAPPCPKCGKAMRLSQYEDAEMKCVPWVCFCQKPLVKIARNV